MKPASKQRLLLIFTALTVIIAFLLRPVAQSLSYHHFADQRPLWGIPNFGNVVSNLPYLIIGLYGLVLVGRTPVPPAIRVIYLVLFFGVLLTGLGSSYYHWNPNNDTLIWDRIPMTIIFMSLLSATVAELINRSLGIRLLFPLVAIGIGSVLWWNYTEALGKGDLRPYGWVQFYPALAIPLILWLYYEPGIKPVMRCLILAVVWYAIAKLFEHFDLPVYKAIGISGHTLKHLASAVSTWYFVELFRRKYLSHNKSSADQ